MKPNPEIPPAFLARMQRLLGDEYQPFRRALDEPSAQGLRINPLKTDPERLFHLLGERYPGVPWAPDGYLPPAGQKLGAHPYHAAGLYYLQDPAAMAVAWLLAPQPGELVLDLAAAPGGKATHIAGMMLGKGLLVANDIDPRRARDLAENLARWGVKNAVVSSLSPDQLAAFFGPCFDRVLVDAPCSGEALFRKNPAARLEWSPRHVQQCAVRQEKILKYAVRLVRPGGRLVYATCTFAPEENEAVVGGLVHENPEFSLISVTGPKEMDPGRPEWLPAWMRDPALADTKRLWPHKAPGEGHFIAVLEKTDGPSSSRPLSPSPGNIPGQALGALQTFTDRYLKIALDPAHLLLRGHTVYEQPSISPNLDGLSVLHPGWQVGRMRGQRFEPAHWLAMSLRLEDARLIENFSAEDPGLQTYLRGGGQANDGSDGWVLVGVDGFSIGWAKRSKKQLKSKYPRSLRIR
ncbi:MAG: RsmB/NOP family class I SAM-dependent RNA methyltransferase [Anaerolineales bacterium]|nr:RsmB/NOP family class I SAM-dependent RNA methyltransferase [Anaerolineales bacterium]